MLGNISTVHLLTDTDACGIHQIMFISWKTFVRLVNWLLIRCSLTDGKCDILAPDISFYAYFVPFNYSGTFYFKSEKEEG